ncbi:hypothetical protein GW17_00053603, partial [Ensete ventricosum]
MMSRCKLTDMTVFSKLGRSSTAVITSHGTPSAVFSGLLFDTNLETSTPDTYHPEEDSCPICLEDYDLVNPRIMTKCEHHFHCLAFLNGWRDESHVPSVTRNYLSCARPALFSTLSSGYFDTLFRSFGLTDTLVGASIPYKVTLWQQRLPRPATMLYNTGMMKSRIKRAGRGARSSFVATPDRWETSRSSAASFASSVVTGGSKPSVRKRNAFKAFLRALVSFFSSSSSSSKPQIMSPRPGTTRTRESPY